MSDTVPIPGNDAEMNAAMEEARRRLPELRRALDEDARRIIPVIEGALVKAAVTSPSTGETEHIWLEDIGFEEDRIVGTVASAPNAIPEVVKGEDITVSPHDISDWVYREGRRTFGGFTVRLMQQRGEDP
jgi:uncharacterized protein YegJ (DUF2314 family)